MLIGLCGWPCASSNQVACVTETSLSRREGPSTEVFCPIGHTHRPVSGDTPPGYRGTHLGSWVASVSDLPKGIEWRVEPCMCTPKASLRPKTYIISTQTTFILLKSYHFYGNGFLMNIITTEVDQCSLFRRKHKTQLLVLFCNSFFINPWDRWSLYLYINETGSAFNPVESSCDDVQN